MEIPSPSSGEHDEIHTAYRTKVTDQGRVEMLRARSAEKVDDLKRVASTRAIDKETTDIPPPPRDEASFRAFYIGTRARMIGLVRVQAAGKVDDLELVTEEGWRKFFPHWKDCRHPNAYVRQCMITATNDALTRFRD